MSSFCAMEKIEGKVRKSEIERKKVKAEQKTRAKKKKFTCSEELRIDRKIEQ